MKFAYTLLSAWAAAAAAYKQSGRSSSEDGLLRDGKSKKDPTTKRVVSCDPRTEEICYDYDETYLKSVSCALISDGGCPCPEGTNRCGADLANGYVGGCTDLCCDWGNEYECYGSYWDGDINFKACGTHKDGCPCPDGQTECYQGFCSNACCDMSTEQHCYGPDSTSFCVPFAESCPCPDGQEWCGADPENQVSGWCAMECCNSNYEETCFEYDDGYFKQHTNQYCAAIADGGCPCPGDQVKCDADLSANYAGWCADVCCDYNTEETCYNPPSCAPFADGGCPCPPGQEMCGRTFGDTGWCADDCCDQNTEETCYNNTGYYGYQYCVAISEGGCPCPDGTERCGADLENNIIGWCDRICCNATTEETCHDWDEVDDNGFAKGYCAAIADGGCPCPDGTERCGADLEDNILGWCDRICCNATTEETCHDWDGSEEIGNPYCAAIADGGCPCPDGTVKCGADLENGNTGWCTDNCCATTQEPCYDYYDNGTINNYCAAIADGGCPCPDGTEKCGADLENNIPGWCTDICCDVATQETCYDWESGNYNHYCAAISDGGCPCPDGTERCGVDLENNDVGWCVVICCNATTEETCPDWDEVDDIGNPKIYCAAIADGGCPESSVSR